MKFIRNEDLLTGFEESKLIGQVSDTLKILLTKMSNDFIIKWDWSNYSSVELEFIKLYSISCLLKNWYYSPKTSKDFPYWFYSRILKENLRLIIIPYVDGIKKNKERFDNLKMLLE